jgi:hypothetical protein
MRASHAASCGSVDVCCSTELSHFHELHYHFLLECNWVCMQDLNIRPQLGDMVEPSSIAAVLCANGVQYLTRPEWVLAEVLKVIDRGQGGREAGTGGAAHLEVLILLGHTLSTHGIYRCSASSWQSACFCAVPAAHVDPGCFRAAQITCQEPEVASPHTSGAQVLQPGGVLVVSFSPYCFESKATSAWLQRSSKERLNLVGSIAAAVGFERVRFTAVAPCNSNQREASEGSQQAAGLRIRLSESTDVAWLQEALSQHPSQQGTSQTVGDPLFAVVAYKPLRPSGVTGVVLPFPGSAELRQRGGWGAAGSSGRPSEQEGSDGTSGPASEAHGMSPSDVAASFVAPALLELDLKLKPSARSNSHLPSTTGKGSSEGTQAAHGALKQGPAGSLQPDVPVGSAQSHRSDLDESGQKEDTAKQQPAIVLQQQHQQQTCKRGPDQSVISSGLHTQNAPALTGALPGHQASGAQVGEATLQRWRVAYEAMSHDAQVC